MINENSKLNLVFSTPIWTSMVNDYQNLNVKMLEYIKDIKKNNNLGIHKSNKMGWHSPDFNLKDKSVQEFINIISPNVKKVFDDMGWDKKKNETKITNMWSIINKKEAFNSKHIHSNCYLSAAYYIKAPENSGKIYFYDPRIANVYRKPVIERSTPLNSERAEIVPKEGLLILFPSFIEHSVGPNLSEDERIVISFNLDMIYLK